MAEWVDDVVGCVYRVAVEFCLFFFCIAEDCYAFFFIFFLKSRCGRCIDEKDM